MPCHSQLQGTAWLLPMWLPRMPNTTTADRLSLPLAATGFSPTLLATGFSPALLATGFSPTLLATGFSPTSLLGLLAVAARGHPVSALALLGAHRRRVRVSARPSAAPRVSPQFRALLRRTFPFARQSPFPIGARRLCVPSSRTFHATFLVWALLPVYAKEALLPFIERRY